MVYPVLNAAQGLTNGVGTGLIRGASAIGGGVNLVGSGANHLVNGVGSVLTGGVSGLGQTVANLPKALYGLFRALGHSHRGASGIVSGLLGGLFG